MATPSSPSYTIEQYLLDRALIEDTIKTMYLLYDERRTSLLSKTVFAETVHVDYTSLLGGEPYTVSGPGYERNLEQILGGIRKNQHAVAGIVSHLPYPGAAPPPDKVLAVAQGIVAMVMNSGQLVQDGALMYVDLVRTGVQGQNPWRIAGIKMQLVWVTHGEDKSGSPLPS